MLRCMRTTVRLDDELLAAAKRRALATNTTLTSVIEDALRASLARRPATSARRTQLTTFGQGGLRSGVDLDESAGLRDVMDGE